MTTIVEAFKQQQGGIINQVFSNGASDPAKFATMWSKATPEQQAKMLQAYQTLGVVTGTDASGIPQINFAKVQHIGTELFNASKAIQQNKTFTFSSAITLQTIQAMSDLATNAKVAMAAPANPTTAATFTGQTTPPAGGAQLAAYTPGAPTGLSTANSPTALTPAARDAAQLNQAANTRALELIRKLQTQLLGDINTQIATKPEIGPFIREYSDKMLAILGELLDPNLTDPNLRKSKLATLQTTVQAINSLQGVDRTWKDNFFRTISLALNNTKTEVAQNMQAFKNHISITKMDMDLQESIALFDSKIELKGAQIDAKTARAEADEARADRRKETEERKAALENDPDIIALDKRIAIAEREAKLEKYEADKFRADQQKAKQTETVADLETREHETLVKAEIASIQRAVVTNNSLFDRQNRRENSGSSRFRLNPKQDGPFLSIYKAYREAKSRKDNSSNGSDIRVTTPEQEAYKRYVDEMGGNVGSSTPSSVDGLVRAYLAKRHGWNQGAPATDPNRFVV